MYRFICGASKRLVRKMSIRTTSVLSARTGLIYTGAKKCLFQTHHQSPSAMTRNNYLIFVLIGWLPGCGYISARGKRNNIQSVCARVYTNAKGIPCRFCAGCFRLTARLIDDHNSTSYTQNTPPTIYPYYMLSLLLGIVT